MWAGFFVLLLCCVRIGEQEMHPPVGAVNQINFLEAFCRPVGLPSAKQQFAELHEGALVLGKKRNSSLEFRPRHVIVQLGILENSQQVLHIGVARCHFRSLFQVCTRTVEFPPPQFIQRLVDFRL